MSRYDEEKSLLEFFCVIMAGKIRANRHKRHWESHTQAELFKRLKEEVDELREVLERKHDSKVALEAADVALYSAMLAWNATSNEECKTRSKRKLKKRK